MSMQMQSEKKKAAVQEKHSLTTPPSPESPPPPNKPPQIPLAVMARRPDSSRLRLYFSGSWNGRIKKKCDTVS